MAMFPKPKKNMSKKIPVICSMTLCGLFIAWLQFSGSPTPIADKPDLPNDPISKWTEVSSKWSGWADDYQAAAEAEQDSLIVQGVALVRERRAAMLELIQTDPQAALAAAMPRAERERLPTEIQEQLETIISVRAPLDLVATCFHPDEPDKCTHDHEEHHSTFFDGKPYQVHVYGSRLNDLSIPNTSMHGIAIDNHLALSESRVRVLDADETLLAGISLPTPEAVAVEANGEVTVLPSIEALPEFEAAILDGEDNPTYIASDAGDGTSTISRRPNEAHASGDKKLLLILVDYSDLPGRPLNRSAGNQPLTEQMASNLINGSNGVRQFFIDSSFGKTDVIMAPTVNGDSPDITAVLRMPETASYYSNTGGSTALNAHARAAATAAGYDPDGFQRVCVYTTNLANYGGGTLFNGWGGRAAVGGVTSTYNGFWDFRVVAHELGHNWGLRHANLWRVTDGNPGSLAGTSIAYGDDFDTMGAAAGSHLKHFSPWNKSLLWWIPDAAIPAAQTSGIYRVHRFDHGSANLALPRALKIVRDDTRDYWIGYRRANPSTGFYNGAYVTWGYNDGRKEGDLLDMNTPGTGIADAALNMNQTYTNSEGSVEFTPIAQGGSGGDEWIDIQVVFPGEHFIEFSSSTFSVNYDEGSVNLSVNRSQNSTGSVSVNYATSPGSASAPTDYATTTGALNWADGDLAPKSIVVPINPDGLGNESEKTFSVTLTSPAGAVIGANATATVTITYIQPPVVNAGSGQTLIIDTAPWSPMALGTPLAWYDASDASSVIGAGGAVSQWLDKSGNSRDIAQTTPANQPSYGNDTVTFDGTGDYLWRNESFLFANGQADVFIVGSIAALSDRRIVAEASSSAVAQIYGIAQNNNTSAGSMGTFIRNDTNANIPGHVQLSSADAFDGTRKMFQWRDTGSSLSARIDSIERATTNYSRNGSLTLDRFSVGALLRGAPGNFAQGGINEIVLSNNLTDRDREKLEGYLAHKWELSGNLPASHPYKDAAPGIVGAMANLAGTVNHSGGSVTTAWSVLSGPEGGAHIATPSSLTSGVTFSLPGIYVLRLTVSNGLSTVISDVTYTINPTNEAPVFAADPFSAPDADQGETYGASIADSASDANGDTLTYSKVSGPAWLDVLPDGSLSGTPAQADIGLNAFIVSVSDGIADPVLATLEITVLAAPQSVLVFADDFEPGPNAFGGSSPDVSSYSIANTSQQVNADLWVRTTGGFAANRNGIIDESENNGATFSDPTGTQAWSGRYRVNTGLTSAFGKIGSLTAGQTITVQFDAVIDGWLDDPATAGLHGNTVNGKDIAAYLVLFDGASTRTAMNPNFSNYINNTSAVLAALVDTTSVTTSYQTFSFSYTVGDDVIDNNGAATGASTAWNPALLGQDIAIRFGPANRCIIDNVKVFFGDPSGGNSAPIASNGAFTTDQDTALAVTLTASDADGDSLTYSVVTQPDNGTLSGSGANRTYTPNLGFSGSDSFTFIANDGQADSGIATISISVNEVEPPPPVLYTVSYLGNGNTGGSVPSDQSKEENVALTLSGSGTLERTGYGFTGWNTAANGSGIPYPAGATYTDNAPLTLHAQWAGNTSTVTFDANGGDAPSPTTKQVTFESAYGTLPTVSRTGYNFLGWFTDASGGTEVTPSTTVATTDDHTIYARWIGEFVDLDTAGDAMPLQAGHQDWQLVFSDEFNGTEVDTNKWNIDNSATSRSSRPERGINQWFWRPQNVRLENGNLVLDVTKHNAGTMHCGSINSKDLFEPMYGYFETRVEIGDSTKDTHTAFWLQGHEMTGSAVITGDAHNGAEVDVFESAWFGDYTKAVVHIDGYGADRQASTKQYSTPGLHEGFNVFGLEWTASYMKIYYNGVHKITYDGTWVPRANEWVWLSNGASFGDIGTFSQEEIGWLTSARFDYVRVWQATANQPPVFAQDSMQRALAMTNEAYGATLAGSSIDPELDALTYSKVSGPAWLNVAADGTLTGTPSGGDKGTNIWTVQVSDGQGGIDQATLEITVQDPGDPILLVGGSLLNGDFNAAPGVSVTFASTPVWYNTRGTQTAVATRNDITYDGTQNAILHTGRGYGVDTGYTIAEGNLFDFSYVWKDDWQWVGSTGQVKVSLFVTDDNTITGNRTDLLVDDSGIRQVAGAYESVSREQVYTATAADAGKTLFAAIETDSAGFARLDNFVLVVTPFLPPPPLVEVPGLVGLTQAGAESALVAANLAAGGVTETYSATVPAGQVAGQNPSGGSMVDVGSPVDLVVSLGPEPATVPNVVGLAQSSAESAIVSANLAVGIVTEAFSDTVPEGHVISQGLTPGASVPQGSGLDLTVSLGIDNSPKLLRTTVSSVSSDSWTTVNLGRAYHSPVIIATPIYPTSGLPPVVTRITNVTGTSFELKIDRADGLTTPVSFGVSVVIVDEGIYTQAEHGVTMEAVKYLSTITSRKASWVGEARSFQNTYTIPVVLGQVMSANDSKWSAFWSMGSSASTPVNSANLNVGKHVGEDPNFARADETIGYIVIESGAGVIDGVAYEAALGAKTVMGFGNSSTPYTYTLSGNLNSASAAAASISGMAGVDGGWAVLSGSPAISSASIGLHVCEDKMSDSEQGHVTEHVGYIAFE